MPPTPCVALFGDFSSEYVDLRSIVTDFGWSLALVEDFSQLATLQARSNVTVVMIYARTLGKSHLATSWGNALSRVRYIAPQARVVICHGSDQALGRRDMLERGAYGVLRCPLDTGEVRQMLGFVWAAQNRLANGSESRLPQDELLENAGDGADTPSVGRSRRLSTTDSC